MTRWFLRDKWTRINTRAGRNAVNIGECPVTNHPEKTEAEMFAMAKHGEARDRAPPNGTQNTIIPVTSSL